MSNLLSKMILPTPKNAMSRPAETQEAPKATAVRASLLPPRAERLFSSQVGELMMDISVPMEKMMNAIGAAMMNGFCP